jgi:hypothetical protein
MTTKEPGSLSENPTAPKMWALRCMLYVLTFAYVLPVIMFGTIAAILSAERKWLGAFICAVACSLYAVVAWKRLHGKLSYIKPPQILELRRQILELRRRMTQ